MFPQRASYTCTALLGTNKAGVLRPDRDGYYTVVLGALNVFNSAGAYYPLAAGKKLFEESSSLMRRIANGALRGEYGHPRKTPDMSMRDFMSRVQDIYEPNVCCHFRKVYLDDSSVKDEKGRPVVAIIGEVKPSGPMGQALKESLENPSENVCFSIRSITEDAMINGVIHKNLKTIVTWDYVNEPGLSVAKKWHAPGLESFQEAEITPANLEALRDHETRLGVSMESHGGVSAASIIKDLGWDRYKRTENGIVVPPSAKW